MVEHISTFIAERLCESICQLVQACVEEELFPDSKDGSIKHKKRDMSEAIGVATDKSLTIDVAQPSVMGDDFSSGSMEGTVGSSLNSTPKIGTFATTPSDGGSGNVYLSSDDILKLLPSELDAAFFEHPGKTLMPGIFASLGPPEWLEINAPLKT